MCRCHIVFIGSRRFYYLVVDKDLEVGGMGVGVFLKGKECDSMPEWNFGTALEKLGYVYHFHWKIGIGGTAGSIEIDFIVDAPSATPIEIMGDYWHPYASGENETIRLAKIREYFKIEPILVEAKKLHSVSAAMVVIGEILP